MKILVTGGAGFIGSHVVDNYIGLGHRVWVIDNESSGKRNQVHKLAKYTRMDIRHRATIKAFFKKNKFDVLNHHAAQMDVRRSVEDPHFDADVNVFGLLNLLEACREQKVKKIVFSASGGTVYGECSRPASEKFYPVPLSPYGITKLAGEKYIQAYSSLYGLKYTIFRYANVFGPRQDPHGEAGVVAIFANCIRNKKAPFIFGTGKQSRDFVFVADVARANGMVLTKGHNRIINIGTSKETSVNDLYRHMREITGFDKKAIYRPKRAGELMRSVLNINLAKNLLHWSPQFSIRNGLEETVRFFSR